MKVHTIHKRRGIGLLGIWIGPETALPISLICAGIFILYVGLIPLLDFWFTPKSKQELIYHSGILSEINKSRRFGDSFILTNDGKQYSFHMERAGDLKGLIGEQILVGSKDSPFLRGAMALHVEHGGVVIRDAEAVIDARRNGSGNWFIYFMPLLALLTAILPLFGGCKILRQRSSDIYKINKNLQ